MFLVGRVRPVLVVIVACLLGIMSATITAPVWTNWLDAEPSGAAGALVSSVAIVLVSFHRTPKRNGLFVIVLLYAVALLSVLFLVSIVVFSRPIAKLLAALGIVTMLLLIPRFPTSKAVQKGQGP